MAKKGTEKANQNEKPKQQSKLTKTLIGVSTGALAIALGVGAGFLFHALTDQKKTITINAADLKVDEADLSLLDTAVLVRCAHIDLDNVLASDIAVVRDRDGEADVGSVILDLAHFL